jgi:hypothetical protein
MHTWKRQLGVPSIDESCGHQRCLCLLSRIVLLSCADSGQRDYLGCVGPQKNLLLFFVFWQGKHLLVELVHKSPVPVVRVGYLEVGNHPKKGQIAFKCSLVAGIHVHPFEEVRKQDRRHPYGSGLDGVYFGSHPSYLCTAASYSWASLSPTCQYHEPTLAYLMQSFL